MKIYGIATGENGVGVGEIITGDTVERHGDYIYLNDIQVYSVFEVVDNDIREYDVQ